MTADRPQWLKTLLGVGVLFGTGVSLAGHILNGSYWMLGIQLPFSAALMWMVIFARMHERWPISLLWIFPLLNIPGLGLIFTAFGSKPIGERQAALVWFVGDLVETAIVILYILWRPRKPKRVRRFVPSGASS